jgi:hypothetical protein
MYDCIIWITLDKNNLHVMPSNHIEDLAVNDTKRTKQSQELNDINIE